MIIKIRKKCDLVFRYLFNPNIKVTRYCRNIYLYKDFMMCSSVIINIIKIKS